MEPLPPLAPAASTDERDELRLDPVPPIPERPPGTVTIALRPFDVSQCIEGIERCCPPGTAPTLRRLLDEAEPYTVGTARGHLLRDVPVADLATAYWELNDAWSVVDRNERLFFHVGGVTQPMVRALRHCPYTPRVEDHRNPSYIHAEVQVAWRNARWRGRAADHAVRCALADRFTLAVRTGPPELKWTRRMVWRLLGQEVRPSRSYRTLPAGALLFRPVPLHLRVAPAAPDETAQSQTARVHAFLDAAVHVHTVTGLAAAGYLAAQEGLVWITGFVSECLVDHRSAGEPERLEAWGIAHDAVMSFARSGE